MSRRVLVLEPDAAGRAVMDRALSGDGCAVWAVGTAAEARALLDGNDAVDVAIVDEIGSRGEVLEDIRWLRREHPRVPVVAIGALLPRRVMQELVRLRVVDVLAKPFTPVELRAAVARAAGAAFARHDEGLEYAAAVGAARGALASGRLDAARPALRRAQAISPFDAEIMTLLALVAELDGRDDDADRGYRAALALRREEDTPAPDPHEGLARLGAYGAARPVAALSDAAREAPVWLVTEPTSELKAPPPGIPGRVVVVGSLGLSTTEPGARYLREAPGGRAFVLVASVLRSETLATVLAPISRGHLVASDATRARLDLARADEERATTAVR